MKAALARIWGALTDAPARRVASSAPASPPADPLPHVVIAPDLTAMLRACGWADPEGWSAVLGAACRVHGITQRRHLAALVATCTVETAGGRRLVESLDYAPDRLRAMFGARATPAALEACRRDGRPADQRTIANLVYGGAWGAQHLGNREPGDGWRFRGRGLIQVTGRANYERLARELGVDLDALTRLMETRTGAADTAARWWAGRGVNRIVDSGDLAAVRRAVNGGTHGLEEMRAAYARAMAA